ncbi:MAG TPA: NmrA family NAD(P)-binding protein [Edaphobacter sp.]|nr:NmrA family NAD(P)-binding protein [Edaphobacter sp.]
MNIILFGATGMVGQGVLRECLLAPDVQRVLSIVRNPSGQQHAKLREVVPTDFYDLSSIESELTGYNVCFFTLGVTSSGMAEQQYNHVTYDLTLAAAKLLARLNSGMTFIYVSGAGTDNTESGRIMWARIKGKTENAILRLPFKAAYMFRPGFIQPLHGVTSKTKSYRVFYAITTPIFPILKSIFPRHIATTEEIGRAMLNVARRGFPKSVLEAGDIIQAGSVTA